MQSSTSSSPLSSSSLSASSEGAPLAQNVSTSTSDKVEAGGQSSDRKFPMPGPSTVQATSVPMARASASSGSMTPPTRVFEPIHPISVPMSRSQASSGFTPTPKSVPMSRCHASSGYSPAELVTSQSTTIVSNLAEN